MPSRPDRESPADPREAWHRLLQVSSRVLRALDEALDAENRLSVSEFDVLITLDNARARQLRMTELARATMLSSGGMTRLAGRLEQHGLLQRVPDPNDARAFRATLTPEGQRKLAQARATHDAVLTRMIGSHTTVQDLRAVERVLGKVVQAW